MTDDDILYLTELIVLLSIAAKQCGVWVIPDRERPLFAVGDYFRRVKLEKIERMELHKAILFDLWHLAPETITDYFAMTVDEDARPAWLIAYYRAKMKYLHFAQPELCASGA